MSEDKILRGDGKIIDNGKLSKAELGLHGNVSNVEFHHEQIMDQMIKVIEFCKMDKKMRAVLLLRLIHGYTIQRMQIYLFMHGHLTGNSHDELIAIEQEGKRLMHECLQNHSMQEITESINATPSVITSLRNEFATPKRFTGLQ